MNAAADLAALPESIPTGPRWKRVARFAGWTLLHCWLVFHCVGLFVAPASVPPSSPLARSAWRVFGKYLEAVYCNHGYHFFAPEPAAGTLLGYTLEFADGRTERGRLPNKQIQPRLLYHRYFMLTERMATFDDLDPELRRQWIETYAQALCRETGAASVSLTRIRHNIPTMERIRAGGALDDPDLFVEDFLGTFTCTR